MLPSLAEMVQGQIAVKTDSLSVTCYILKATCKWQMTTKFFITTNKLLTESLVEVVDGHGVVVSDFFKDEHVGQLAESAQLLKMVSVFNVFQFNFL